MNELKTYRVLVTRTYREYLTVQAKSEDEAWDKARDNDEDCAYESPIKDNCTDHTVCEVELCEAAPVWQNPDFALPLAAADLLEVLETTAGNIRSLIASTNCRTFDVWLATVEAAIAKATDDE